MPLTLPNVTAASAGAYCVEVAGACGSITNSCATLTVLTNTTATALVSQIKCPGETVTFATVASGTGPFSYVWKQRRPHCAGRNPQFTDSLPGAAPL